MISHESLKPVFHSSGGRRRLFAALLGMLGTLALPPFFLLPLLIPSFAGLFLLTVEARDARQAFWSGWWWGLGHFTLGLYWICISLYVEPEKFAWLTPFALFGLPSVLGIYTGLVTLLLFTLQKRVRMSYAQLVLIFAALWIGVEYARACLFSGFPWNLIGYVWNISTATMQASSLWGIYGQGWFAVCLSTLPALFLLPLSNARTATLTGGVALCAMLLFGAWRLDTHPTVYTDHTLRIVQANIAQSLKFDPKTAMQGLRKHVTLTQEEGIESIDMVIWPETSVPFLIEPALLRNLGSILPERTLLFTGGMRGQGEKATWQAWNSGFVINAKGELVTGYDKHHLVPFGEYIPFRHVLPLENIAGGMGDFSRGKGPQTLVMGNFPSFSPLICYEVIFPDEITDGSASPQWLANITNDAWFGTSTGPYQHLEMARSRAVEQGLPLIRAANTGISIVTDAYGRVLQSLPLNTAGIIDSKLPVATGAKTISSRLGDKIIIVFIYMFVYLVVLGGRKHLKR